MILGGACSKIFNDSLALSPSTSRNRITCGTKIDVGSENRVTGRLSTKCEKTMLASKRFDTPIVVQNPKDESEDSTTGSVSPANNNTHSKESSFALTLFLVHEKVILPPKYYYCCYNSHWTAIVDIVLVVVVLLKMDDWYLPIVEVID